MATNENATSATTATAEAENAAQKRVWVRILKNRVHAEGGFFRAGARVKLAADIAEEMIADKKAVRLPDYY